MIDVLMRVNDGRVCLLGREADGVEKDENTKLQPKCSGKDFLRQLGDLHNGVNRFLGREVC